MAGKITHYLKKELKQRKKEAFLVSNYFSQSALLISRFHLKRTVKNIAQVLCLYINAVVRGQNKGCCQVNFTLFLNNSTTSNFNWKVKKISKLAKDQCLDISNLVNTKVPRYIKQQLHGQSNHLLSAKKTKKGRRKLTSHLELFQQVQFINFYICMTCKLQKARKPL